MTEWFKTGVRILMLMHRRKDGGPKRKDRKAQRLISRNPEEFDEHWKYLQELKNSSTLPYRIYSSVNERDIIKAIRLYKTQQLELEWQDIKNQMNFYVQTENQFMSCLAKPPCAKTKKFLIDLDDTTLLNQTKEKLENITKIIDVRNTRNGYHMITEPYNPNLTPELEVKKDAMILLEW